MRVDIPLAEQQRLAEQAAAFGYGSLDAFVGALLSNVASLSPDAAVFAPLSEAEKARSEALLKRGEADLGAGRVRDMRDGLRELGARRGLTPDP